MKHDEQPQKPNEMPPDLLRKIEAIQRSPYLSYVKELAPFVVGKTVLKTQAGNSGFVLYLDNGKWVLAHLYENEFRWKQGEGVLNEADAKLMSSDLFGDASSPLKENIPYAKESCNLSAQLNNAVGKTIDGLSCGERCFNFCFPEGRELDVKICKDSKGKIAYRVYWEQW